MFFVWYDNDEMRIFIDSRYPNSPKVRLPVYIYIWVIYAATITGNNE